MRLTSVFAWLCNSALIFDAAAVENVHSDLKGKTSIVSRVWFSTGTIRTNVSLTRDIGGQRWSFVGCSGTKRLLFRQPSITNSCFTPTLAGISSPKPPRRSLHSHCRCTCCLVAAALQKQPTLGRQRSCRRPYQ